MKKLYFLDLLHKYLDGKASEEEKNFLLQYYNLFESEEDVMELWPKEKKQQLEEEIRASIWQNINDYEKPMARVRTMTRLSRGVAATIFIAISMTGLFFWNNKTEKTSVDQHIPVQVVENQKIFLPDGSTVIVPAGSKLHYPSSFDSLRTRDVYLDGEAFFDIRHNASRPFIVHSGMVNTTVLGTAFNVKAFSQDSNITVTVIRGKVAVSDEKQMLGIITQNQQIKYNKHDGHSSQAVVPIEPYMEWQTQNLLLDNVTVGEAAELLEQRFNVRLVFTSDEIKSKRFTTTLIQGETLEQALKLICEFNAAVYRFDPSNSSVIIIDDPSQTP